jgi:hypothetical protein
MTIARHYLSLLVQLRNAKAMEFNDALRELLDHPDALEQVPKIVVSRIDAGAYVLDASLASLVLQTKDPRLYEKVRDQLFKNEEQMLRLYMGRYPDPEIEYRLCAKLCEIAAIDGNPLRIYIVEAMREVGTDAALPTLEAIFYDLEPRAKIRQTFADALGVLGNPRAINEFLKGVELAIEEIKNRMRSEAEPAEASSPADLRAKPLSDGNNTTDLGRKAQLYIDADNPDVAVMLLRRGAEAIAKNSYRHLGYEQKGKPARKMMLEELLKSLKDGGAPEVFTQLLQTLQLFGNFAVHCQDDQSQTITKEIAQALLVLYDQAVVSHSRWVGSID